jgi:hypothetical protein
MLSCGCNKYEYTPHLHILLHGLFKDPFRYNPILIVFMCFGFFFHVLCSSFCLLDAGRIDGCFTMIVHAHKF